MSSDTFQLGTMADGMAMELAVRKAQFGGSLGGAEAIWLERLGIRKRAGSNGYTPWNDDAEPYTWRKTLPR